MNILATFLSSFRSIFPSLQGEGWRGAVGSRVGVRLLFFLPLPLFSETIPSGYYDRIDGLNDATLKGTLRLIIRPRTVIPYGSGTNSTWNVFYYSDRDPATGLCMDMYCDDWKPFTTPGKVVSGCNVEHSFAKSWWGGAENDAYKDCHHLNPSNSTANSARSNYPLGDVPNPTKTAGSLKIGQRYHEGLGETHYVWEPKDEYKGDFARAYFYMATCYGHDLDGSVPDLKPTSKKNYNGWRIDNKDVGSRYAMQNDNYLEFQDWEIDVLLRWHRQDPVSDKELRRQDAVSDFQHNRNPYIDYPDLVEYIWGNRKGEAVDLLDITSITAPILSPVPGSAPVPGAFPPGSSPAKVLIGGQIYIKTPDGLYDLTGVKQQ